MLSIFSGIGGLELGLSMGGDFHPVAFVERNLYARAVLAKNWPGVPQYDDVKTVSGHALAADGVGQVDVIAGGWPCQPHSVAGKRGNSTDERDLWAEFARLIGETQPRWVVGENVPGVLSSHDAAADRGPGGFFGRVLRDLAALGYDAEWHCFAAATLGAQHERNRLFLVAYPAENSGSGLSKRTPTEQAQLGSKGSDVANPHGLRESQPEGRITDQRRRAFNSGEKPGAVAYPHGAGLEIRQGVSGDPCPEQQAAERGGSEMGHSAGQGLPDWAGGTLGQPYPVTEFERPGGREVERDFCGMAHGVSARVDRLRCLGNGVVPQQAAVIGRAITGAETHYARFGMMPNQIIQRCHLGGIYE